MKPTLSKSAALILVGASPLQAATKTWDGGAATANWSDAASWNADGTPTSSDAVLLDNSTVNPLPQINAQSGANCGSLTIDGAISGTFLNYAGATPLVTNLYGASVNPANTGPLIHITANAPASLTANKVNFQLRTNGQLFVASGKTFTFSNSYLSQNGTRSLTKTGAGTVQFSGSGSSVTFTGGLNMAEGVWNASADTEDLPVAGTVTFTNPSGTAATITSTNSHSIAALAGGNSNSEFHATGSTGLTLTGSATTTFNGRLRGNTKLTHNGTGSLTLNGSNAFTGATTINAGTLAVGASGSISSTPLVAIAGGATFDVSALAAGFTLGTGKSISGSGTVAGKLNLSSDATLSPGGTGVGTLTITNGLTLAADSHLDLDLNGPASHDAVTVTGGNVSLAADSLACHSRLFTRHRRHPLPRSQHRPRHHHRHALRHRRRRENRNRRQVVARQLHLRPRRRGLSNKRHGQRRRHPAHRRPVAERAGHEHRRRDGWSGDAAFTLLGGQCDDRDRLPCLSSAG
jgi:fibronectin-binding autotransporter adhesin